MIIISQLCDDDLHVHFDKRQCYVLKEDEECVIIGTRILDNCYQINKAIDSISMNVQIHDIALWHKKLGHVNYKLLHKLGHKGIVREMPAFEKENKVVRRDC